MGSPKVSKQKSRSRRTGQRRSRNKSERSLDDSIVGGSGEPALPPSASFERENQKNGEGDSSSPNDTDAYQADLEASADVLSLVGAEDDQDDVVIRDGQQQADRKNQTNSATAKRPQRPEPPGTLKKKASKHSLDLSEEDFDDLENDQQQDKKNQTDSATATRPQRPQPPGTLKKKASKLSLDLLSEEEFDQLEKEYADSDDEYDLENGYADSDDDYDATDGHDGNENHSEYNKDDDDDDNNIITMERLQREYQVMNQSVVSLDLLSTGSDEENDDGEYSKDNIITMERLQQEYQNMNQSVVSLDLLSTGSDEENDDGEYSKDNNKTMEWLQREYDDMNQSVVSDDLLYMTTDDEQSYCTFDGGISACSLDMDEFLDQLDEDEQDYNTGAIPTSISTPATAPSEQAPVQRQGSRKKTTSYREEKKQNSSKLCEKLSSYKLWGQLACFSMIVAVIVVVVVLLILPKVGGGDDDNVNDNDCDKSINCTTSDDEPAVEMVTHSRTVPLDLWGILDTMVGVTLPVFLQGCSQYWTVALLEYEHDAFDAAKIHEVECRVLSQELVVKSLQQRLRERLLLRKTAPVRLETVLQVLVEVLVVLPMDEPVDGFDEELLEGIVQETGGDFQGILSTASDFFASMSQIVPWPDDEEPAAGADFGSSQGPPPSTTPPNYTTNTAITTPVPTPAQYILTTAPTVPDETTDTAPVSLPPVFDRTTQAPTPGQFGSVVIALPP